MLRESHRLKIGFGLAAIALCAILTTQPGFAAEAATAHGDGKASPSVAPSGESSPRKSLDEDATKGVTNADDKRSARGDEGRIQQGDRGRTEPGAMEKSLDTGAPGATNPTDIDTRISVQPRRLGGKPDKVGGKSAIGLPLARKLQRPTPPTPRMLNVPVRNALGVPVQQHERRDLSRPHAPAAAAPAGSVGATAVPSNAGIHTNRAEGSPDHRGAITTPAIVPPLANRAAINGTGLTNRNVGPPLIGGPKAAIAGINGTAIKPKR
jgi:hypothetical protein